MMRILFPTCSCGTRMWSCQRAAMTFAATPPSAKAEETAAVRPTADREE